MITAVIATTIVAAIAVTAIEHEVHSVEVSGQISGLRVRAEITSAFRIPSAPHLRLELNREILNVAWATPLISLNPTNQICGTSGRAKPEVISARTLTGNDHVVISMTGDQTHRATTRAGGLFSISDVEPGNYSITPIHSRYTFHPAKMVVSVEDRAL